VRLLDIDPAVDPAASGAIDELVRVKRNVVVRGIMNAFDVKIVVVEREHVRVAENVIAVGRRISVRWHVARSAGAIGRTPAATFVPRRRYERPIAVVHYVTAEAESAIARLSRLRDGKSGAEHRRQNECEKREWREEAGVSHVVRLAGHWRSFRWLAQAREHA